MLEITGSCHCKQVQYQAQVNPEFVRICHCSDCQILSGSAFRVNLPTQAKDFTLLKGKLKSYIKTAANGNLRAQKFCGECGSQIYATAAKPDDSQEQVYNLRVGTVDQRNQLPALAEQWQSSRLPWLKPMT